MALENDGKLNAYMQESFENIKIVKALNAEKNLSSNLCSVCNDLWSVWYCSRIFNLWFFSRIITSYKLL